MTSFLHVAAAAALLSVAMGAAWGQAAAPSRPTAVASAPAASAASAPAYRSAFEGYTGHADVPVRPWREVNDQVGRIGGWRVYAREGQGSGPSPAAGGHAGHAAGPAARPAAGASSAAAATGGHAGHRP